MNTSTSTTGRVMSLDALRGFDMLMIMGMGAVYAAVMKVIGCTEPIWTEQFRHVDWHGLHFVDTIFALFLFIAGTSFAFSCAKHRAHGDSTPRLVGCVLRRAGLLFLFGLIYNDLLKFDFKNLVWGSVLGRIGVAWGIAALIYLFASWRKRLVIMAGILVGYWLCTFLLFAPDHPTAAVLTPEGNFACYLDRVLMPGKLTIAGLYTNQGIVGTISAAVTALLGMAAGDVLRSAAFTPTRKAGILAGGAAVLLILGCFVAYGCGVWSFPINKKLWSPSFVLIAGAYSSGMLALFYYLIDVRGFVKWALAFRVIGLNAIAIYLFRRFFSLDALSRTLFGGLAQCVPAEYGALILAVGTVILGWLFLYFLHRHKIYFKI